MGHCRHHLNRKPLLPRPVRAGSPFRYDLLFKTRAPSDFLCYPKTWGLGKSTLSLVFLLHQLLLCLFCESFSEGLSSTIQLTLGGREIPSLCSLRLRPGWGHPGLESWCQIRVLGFQLQNLFFQPREGVRSYPQHTAQTPEQTMKQTLASVSKQGHCWNLVTPEGSTGKSRGLRGVDSGVCGETRTSLGHGVWRPGGGGTTLLFCFKPG